MLKKMELERKAPRKLDMIRFARGERLMRRRGMMGLATRDSTTRKAGKQTAKAVRQTMTKGWDPANSG